MHAAVEKSAGPSLRRSSRRWAKAHEDRSCTRQLLLVWAAAAVAVALVWPAGSSGDISLRRGASITSVVIISTSTTTTTITSGVLTGLGGVGCRGGARAVVVT